MLHHTYSHLKWGETQSSGTFAKGKFFKNVLLCDKKKEVTKMALAYELRESQSGGNISRVREHIIWGTKSGNCLHACFCGVTSM